MFQFPGLPPRGYVFTTGCAGMTPRGFPHSETRGSEAVCAFPRVIAACRVLHRLPVPRHPPCALDIFPAHPAWGLVLNYFYMMQLFVSRSHQKSFIQRRLACGRLAPAVKVVYSLRSYSRSHESPQDVKPVIAVNALGDKSVMIVSS
jgi:hypothetical protein